MNYAHRIQDEVCRKFHCTRVDRLMVAVLVCTAFAAGVLVTGVVYDYRAAAVTAPAPAVWLVQI